MHRLLIISGIVALVAAGGCGGKTAEERAAEDAAKAAEQASQGAEEASKGAEQAAQGAEQAMKGLESMAKSLGAMAGAASDVKVVEPVSFRELQVAFADFDGWVKGKPTGEKMSTPVSFSQAEVVYTKGDARIEVKIVDSGFNQIMMAPYTMFLAAGYEKETQSGYEKSTQVAGYPGWEEWNADGKDGTLNAVVNKRFLVTFEGSGVEDTKVLHQLAAATNLKKLASLQ